jgi:hypothetical protein
MRVLILLIALSGMLFLEACNGCGPGPTNPLLTWGVLDKTTNIQYTARGRGHYERSSKRSVLGMAVFGLRTRIAVLSFRLFFQFA